MPRINIIGIGPGDQGSLTQEAENAIRRSKGLLGDKRVVAPFAESGKSIVYSSNAGEIAGYLQTCDDQEEVSILVSGDVGFYSLTKNLLACGEDKNKIHLICGISSLQYFCAKLQVAWDDVVTVSLHGREANLLAKVRKYRKVFVLTGGKNTPAAVCKSLCAYGFDSLQVSVGENLSYTNEKITTAPARDIKETVFAPLSVMLIRNPVPLTQETVNHGLPDHVFIRGSVPMTKQEVRAVSLAKLALGPADIAYDIGAGTGSVAVEMARQLPDGYVYAIEKDEEALALIQKNKQKFLAANLDIISALAPSGLESLPPPDKVFIGGSGGNLAAILHTVFAKNPGVRVVINAITLETLNQAVSYEKENPGLEMEVVQMTVSKSRKVGNSHLMTGQNPVNIITLQKERGND
jgi:precorrin-6Y C5,15-methyltransferase (decarboxylating)